MRLFKKKPSTAASTPVGAPEAAAEAEAELRRAAEALGVPSPGDADALAEEVLADAVRAPGDADPPWEDSGVPEPEEVDLALADPLPEEAPSAEPTRRRVRKTPPRAAGAERRTTAATAPPRARAPGQRSRTTRS